MIKIKFANENVGERIMSCLFQVGFYPFHYPELSTRGSKSE